MPSHDPSSPPPGARILNFRRGSASARPPRPDPDREVVEDLSKYSQDEVPDDFRHRMAVNIAAFVVLAGLCGVGYWLADSMAAMRKNQDCVLSGRRNCAQVDIPAKERY